MRTSRAPAWRPPASDEQLPSAPRLHRAAANGHANLRVRLQTLLAGLCTSPTLCVTSLSTLADSLLLPLVACAMHACKAMRQAWRMCTQVQVAARVCWWLFAAGAPLASVLRLGGSAPRSRMGCSMPALSDMLQTAVGGLLASTNYSSCCSRRPDGCNETLLAQPTSRLLPTRLHEGGDHRRPG